MFKKDEHLQHLFTDEDIKKAFVKSDLLLLFTNQNLNQKTVSYKAQNLKI